MDVLLDSRLLLAAAGLGLLWLGFSLGRAGQRRQLQRNGRRAQIRGERGERSAEKLLRALGYRIHARQVEGSYTLEVDGETREVCVCADLMVERGGVLAVAEVKTGHKAPNIAYAETRRQLLEYQLAFGVPHVWLVDVEAGRVTEVRFPIASAHAESVPRPLAMWVVAAIVLGGVALALLKQRN